MTKYEQKLRDNFAKCAMKTLLQIKIYGWNNPEFVATQAYAYADKMLVERAKVMDYIDEMKC
jgi:hypothetical protein